MHVPNLPSFVNLFFYVCLKHRRLHLPNFNVNFVINSVARRSASDHYAFFARKEPVRGCYVGIHCLARS